MVKENQHLSVCNWSRKSLSGKTQYGRNLLPSHVKPFHDFINGGSSHKVFKDCGHWHTRATKNPCATHFSWNTFYGWTL